MALIQNFSTVWIDPKIRKLVVMVSLKVTYKNLDNTMRGMSWLRYNDPYVAQTAK